MKLINKTLVFLSLVTLGCSSLEAKSIEFLLDHNTQHTFHLQAEIPEQREEQPQTSSALLPYCQQLRIENLGDKPIRNFFPYVNQSPSFSLKNLAVRLAKERYPLLALYQIWNHSLIQDESLAENHCHPLDLLNFKGACSPTTFNQQFLTLCNALGIETRLANVQGQDIYDFGLDDEWNLFDFNHHQFYLRLDNERLASSEDVMDDPFLALRAKHGRKEKQLDFKEAWKQLATFDILHPSSALPVIQTTEDCIHRSNGFNLFPGETLVFENAALRPELASYECAVDHIVNLEARHVSHRWKYVSPLPIHHVTNNSITNLRLVEQNIELKPGESFVFKGEVFQIKFLSDSHPKGNVLISGICAWTLFPSLVNGCNHIHLGGKKNPSIVRLHYEINEELEKNSRSKIHICNQENVFSYCSPSFILKSPVNDVEKIWWQIAIDEKFQLVPSNLDQVEPFTSSVTLPPINETFLSSGSPYYFRVKGYRNGQWSEWSDIYSFTVQKPWAVEEVILEQVNENEYELNWERQAGITDEVVEYLVFGSNSLDFIPSIYCHKQVNAIVNGEVIEEEVNDNFIAVTTEPKIRISGNLAYYRIIAKQRGQLSVPSRIIHVYDQELIQPRNVLQVVKENSQIFAKRLLFPASYPWTKTALPLVSDGSHREVNVIKLQSLLRAVSNLDRKKNGYEFPHVSHEIWQEVRPYLLPENHPAWIKLNRLFCKTRATQSPEHFKKAGFRRWKPGRWSRVSASSHPEFQEYFIKAYCDSEVGIIYDWKKWIHRIEGAECIRACIKEHRLQKNFKVPHKWIYPLPKHPSPPNNSKYVRKNFILVCENMRIQEHSENERMYKHNVDRKIMDGLYTILQVCGLYDSVYVFNMPFCKDGRIAIIDTEYHHKWPVPFHKLTAHFSKSMQSHWKRITFKGGEIPDGISEHNPPRMDRRDVRK